MLGEQKTEKSGVFSFYYVSKTLRSKLFSIVGSLEKFGLLTFLSQNGKHRFSHCFFFLLFFHVIIGIKAKKNCTVTLVEPHACRELLTKFF